MRKSDKKPLLEKLAALSEADRRRLYKQAARKRKAAMSKNQSKRVDFTRQFHDGKLNDTQTFQKHGSKGPRSLDDWVLKLLSEQDFDQKAATRDANIQTNTGMVITTKTRFCKVIFQDKTYKCQLRPELAMAQRSDLAVGDMVNFSQDDRGTCFVEDVLDRKTRLSRPDPHDFRIERVIAANIDTAVVVISGYQLGLNTNLIDRYLLAIDRGDVTPLICINKIDLLQGEQDTDRLTEKMEPYKQLGIKVVRCSAATGEGIDDLMLALAGKLAVLVGHSGVGKSSILNAMVPNLNLHVKKVHGKGQRGRHATIKSNLYRLPQGIRIIDTPGVRSFGLWQMDSHELRWYFSEFDEYVPDCKFSNCTHTHEPDCAVKDAVQEEKIKPARYQSYCHILETLQQD